MSAIFSGETPPLHRYRLDRDISMLYERIVASLLHNPSKAGYERNDPTSTRLIGFAKSWQARRLVMVNPWAGIATNPEDLWKMADPVGPLNDQHIAEVAREVRDSGGIMLAGWGAIKPPVAMRSRAFARLKTVAEIVRDNGCELCAIGVNRGGSPKHPLYARADALPLTWPASWRKAA